MKYRKHIRLTEYDYTSENYYFVTICTRNREKIFVPRLSKKYGELMSQNVVAASYAANNTNIVEKCLYDLEHIFYDNLEIDFYCIMPDHLHIILAFHGNVIKKGAMRSRNYSLGNIVAAFKSIITRNIGKHIWQTNYFERIIRSEYGLESIREYILNNPLAEYDFIPWEKIDPEI